MQSAEEGDAVRLRSTAVGRDRRDASVEAGGGGGSVALWLKAMAGRRRRPVVCRFCTYQSCWIGRIRPIRVGQRHRVAPEQG